MELFNINKINGYDGQGSIIYSLDEGSYNSCYMYLNTCMLSEYDGSINAGQFEKEYRFKKWNYLTH